MAKSNKGILSSTVLKTLAVMAMIVDHACVILYNGEYEIARIIGRLAFPIFAFLISEGVRHTKSKFRYALRLLIFAVLSEIPFDYAFSGTLYDFNEQNVFFTLFLGLISVIIVDKLQNTSFAFLAIFSTLLLSSAAYYIGSDYGFMGVLVITLIFVFSQLKNSAKYVGIALSIAMTCIHVSLPFSLYFIPQQIFAVLAVIPIAMYSGKAGLRLNKYVFYLIYPLHLLVLTLIKVLQ